jgi:type VI secretion system protein ImpJ
MSDTSDVHWSEGQFLRPHHLQLLARRAASTLADEVARLAPFSWGIERIAIAESELANFAFSLRELRLRLRDGTRVEFPGNAEVEPRDFKDALARAAGALDVYLGVPRWSETSPNVALPDETLRPGVRYRVRPIERVDENTAANPQPIDVRVLAARIFFAGDNTDGYDVLRIAQVRRSGTSENLPILAPEFAPALLALSAWPPLVHRVADLVQRLTAISRASISALFETGGGKIRASADILAVLRLQTTTSYALLLKQLLATPGLHPYPVFLELVRLAGDLALFGNLAQPVALPEYDHDALAPSFGRLIEHVDRLLTDVAAPQFEGVRLAPAENRLECALDARWVEQPFRHFLGVESEYTAAQVDAMVRTAKVGAVADLPLFLQRRLPGLKLERIVHVPGDLPLKPEIAYYRIDTAGEFWATVVRDKTLGVTGLADMSVKVTLYLLPGA